MSDMQCPYCGADQEVCHDDGHGYDEGVRHERTATPEEIAAHGITKGNT